VRGARPGGVTLNSRNKLAPGGQADALRAFAEALLPYLREHLQPATPKPEFYSQLDSPLGKRRHLEAARRGALRATKVGRLVLARRDDVDAFIAAHDVTGAERGHAEEDILSDWGLRSGRPR
jgi:excisionase family DNA binding protein